MNVFKTAILLTLLTLFFVYIGQLLGGVNGAILALIFSIGINFFSYFYSDKIILKSYKVIEVGEEEAPGLYRIVKKLSEDADIPMPKICVIKDKSPNAFATGRNPKHAVVVATTGIMDILTEDELKGVMAHELSHVLHRDILVGSIAASFAGAIMLIATMARYSMLFGRRGSGGNMFVVLILTILAPVGALVIQMAISRSREYMADESGAKISNKPLALASALEKISKKAEETQLKNANLQTAHMMICNPFRGGGLGSLFSTHPKTEDRVKRLKEIHEKMEVKTS